MMEHARLQVTRRQLETIGWNTLKPEGARHFDRIEWGTHTVTFHFRHDTLEGLYKASFYAKTNGEFVVTDPVKVKELL